MWTKVYARAKRFWQEISHAAILVGLLVGLGVQPAQASGQVFVVDTRIDSNEARYQVCGLWKNDCSLRGAISRSQTSFGKPTIQAPAGIYMLTLEGIEDDNAGGDLDIRHAVIIEGAGETNTVIDGNGLDRVFHIHSGVEAEFRNLRITGGRASGNGGGILNAGVLTLSDSTVSGNRTGDGAPGSPGGDGGGIFNSGVMTILSSSIIANTTGDGANAGGEFMSYNGGSGGGIFNSGSGSLVDSQVSANRTGDGGDFLSPYWIFGASGGAGGGIYSSGTLTIHHSAITGNLTGNAGINEDDYHWWDGSYGGSGGGVYSSGTMTITRSAITGNLAGEGRVGGHGGGVFNSGVAALIQDTISGNTSGDGRWESGNGGGVYDSGLITLIQNIISHNQTGVSDSGYGGGGGGVCALGDPLTMRDEPVWVNNLIAGNTVNPGDPGGNGSGVLFYWRVARLLHTTFVQNESSGGIFVDASTVWLTNTIVVGHAIGVITTQEDTSSTTLEATLWGSGAWANQQDWAGKPPIIGAHNYWGDPAFVNPAGLDYHLSASSVAIDRGVDAGVLFDFDGWPRPNPATGIPDLGFDEFWEAFWLFLPFLMRLKP